MQYNYNDLHELQSKLEYQAQQISLLEDELLETTKALQEKEHFANALEQDLEHAIYNLQKFSALTSNVMITVAEKLQ